MSQIAEDAIQFIIDFGFILRAFEGLFTSLGSDIIRLKSEIPLYLLPRQ